MVGGPDDLRGGGSRCRSDGSSKTAAASRFLFRISGRRGATSNSSAYRPSRLAALDTPVRARFRSAGVGAARSTAASAAATAVLAATRQRSRRILRAARCRRGSVLGALDAWRHRAARSGDAIATGSVAADEPWRGSGAVWLVANAASVPPAIEVSAGPGNRASGRADGDWPCACATFPAVTRSCCHRSPRGSSDLARKWTTRSGSGRPPSPGVYEGEWRAPLAGLYNVRVVAGELRGGATIAVAADVRHGLGRRSRRDWRSRRRASGGQRISDRRHAGAGRRDEDRRTRRAGSSGASHPMRSPWWVLPFAGLLCAEWAARRKRGLP